MLKLKLQYFGHLMQRTDSLEKTLMLGKIEGRRRRGWQGWDGCMASPTQWTWVWVDSGSWWWTGRPGVLPSMRPQRIRHDWVTELNWTELAWNVSLVSLIFWKRYLVFRILLFSSISLHWSLRKAFLSLLILWTSAFKWVYLSFSPLPFALFSAICKASSDNHFALLYFFYLGMVLITASCTMSWISTHS